MDFWYALSKDVIQLYQTLCITPWVRGKEHIPGGPKIIVGNHSLASDAFVLPFIFREKLHFLIEHEIFKIRFVGKLLELADQIPVVKGRGLEALRAARQKLEAGHAVVVFPEGRLNNGEQLYRAHAGAALLAAQTGVPVIPVGFYTPDRYVRIVQGRLDNRAASGAWQFGGPLFVNIGEPLRAVQTSNEYIALRRFTEQVMATVSDLINELRSGSLGSPLGD